MPLDEPSVVSARGICDSCAQPFAYRNQQFHPSNLKDWEYTMAQSFSGGNFVALPAGHESNGPRNGPKIMRRANELGLGSVLLFAAAVLCCHAQAASDCALPEGLQSRASADPFTAWDSAGTWYAQRKDLRCASDAYNKALRLRPQSWRTLYDLGVVEVAQKRLTSAILHLRRAVDLKPDSVDARTALGTALKRLRAAGRGGKAISGDLEGRPELG